VSKDTVLELRRLADKMAGTTAVIVFNSTLRDAADEIERLRVQALGTQRRIQDQDAIMAELWERIHALTTERDEARREILLWVKERCSWAELSQEVKKRGWEYLKEVGSERRHRDAAAWSSR
jgi:hypothetical protein